MTTMRAKMIVRYVEKHGDPVSCVSLTFAAVGKSDGYPADGSDENNTFARWTPSADLQMSVANPALFDAFEVGQQFYVDFTEA